jgi:hypothetical protein
VQHTDQYTRAEDFFPNKLKYQHIHTKLKQKTATRRIRCVSDKANDALLQAAARTAWAA